VRSVLVTPKPAATRKAAGPAPATIERAVAQVAEEQAVPAQLIHSVIQVESNYDPRAVSSKGAMGLMQLVPATARRFGVTDVFDPVNNIQGGAKYLKHLLELYSGDYSLALAAYNAGEGSVARYGGIPPFPETRSYVKQVSQRLAKPRPAAPAPPVVTPAPPGPSHIREIIEPGGAVRYVTQ